MVVPAINRWALSQHAIERAKERAISALELAELISTPEHVIRQGPKWIFVCSFARRQENKVAAVLLGRKELDL